MSGQIFGPLGVLPTGGGGGGGQAFDQVSTNSVTANAGSTLTHTHTPIGAPSAVVVLIMNYETITSVTGVTYGGTSMGAAAITKVSGSTASASYIFGLPGSIGGAGVGQSVVVTLAASGGYTQVFVITVTGSNVSTVFDTINANNSEAPAIGTTPSLPSITSASGEIVVDIVASEGDPTTFVPVGSQIQKGGILSAGGNRAVCSILTATGATSSMGWTLGASEQFCHAAVAFKT